MHKLKFTAKVYLGNDEITHNSGDEAWMSYMTGCWHRPRANSGIFMGS